jgi:hypothetical protein
MRKKMTKEELKKEAEEYAKKWARNEDNKGKAEWACYYNGYLAGAEPREKRIAELEAQIEKMKCCRNCKNEGDYKEPYRYGTGWCNICKRHKVAKGNFDKWEIKEK